MKHPKDTIFGPPCYEPAILVEYIVSLLPTDLKGEIDEHAEECKRCRLEIIRLQDAIKKLEMEPIPETERSKLDSIRERVWQRLAKHLSGFENDASKGIESEPCGTHIKRLRETRGLSIEELSIQAGEISPGDISLVERGNTTLSAAVLGRIARVLGEHLLPYMKNDDERTDYLWEFHELEAVSGTRTPDLRAKRALLEAMGLWPE